MISQLLRFRFVALFVHLIGIPSDSKTIPLAPLIHLTAIYVTLLERSAGPSHLGALIFP